MQIELEANPNCAENVQFVFQELEAPQNIRGIRVLDRGAETVCDVTGVEEGGGWVQARVVKVADSGAGYAYLIYGGAWGIRLRPAAHASEPWDLKNSRQWGEPFKLYGKEDIIYA